MSAAEDLIRIIDQRIALALGGAPPVEVARGTISSAAASARRVMVSGIDGSPVAVPVAYPALPVTPAAGDEVVILRRADGWAQLLSVLGRDGDLAAAGGISSGTWTPVAELTTPGTSVPVAGTGVWTRIGPRVFLDGAINGTFDPGDGSGLFRISGLPFSSGQVGTFPGAMAFLLTDPDIVVPSGAQGVWVDVEMVGDEPMLFPYWSGVAFADITWTEATFTGAAELNLSWSLNHTIG